MNKSTSGSSMSKTKIITTLRRVTLFVSKWRVAINIPKNLAFECSTFLKKSNQQC